MRNRFEQFSDLSRAKGWTYKDWNLALYTFLRNEITYGRGPAGRGFGPAGGQLTPAGTRRGPLQPNHGKTGTENARRL